MTEEHMNAYEGLFLFPQGQSADLQAAVDHLKGILSKAGGELISLRKWDERRLAYEIKGNKRGVYFLAYFRAPGPALAEVERALNLSELLLRSMVVRAEHLTQDQMQAADGQAALADEIKLRAQESSGEGEPERDEQPVTVETAKDKATTVES